MSEESPKNAAGAKKVALQLNTPIGEVWEAAALAHGAAKYGAFNWRTKPISYMEHLGALKRHINAVIDRQDIDEESLLHHLAHVKATSGVILDALAHNMVTDDRPNGGASPTLLKALKHA